MGSTNLLEQLTELKEILTFTSLLKGMIEDTVEHPDGRDLRAENVGRGAELPHSLSQHLHVFHSLH